MNTDPQKQLLDSTVKVVSFDAGFTLIEPHPPVGQVYAQVASRRGFQVQPQSLNQRFFKAWEAGLQRVRSGQQDSFNTSEKGARKWWNQIMEETFDGMIPEKAMPELCKAVFDEYASSRCWRLCRGVPEILHKLRQMRPDIRIIILSNWDARIKRVLDEMQLTRHFDRIFYSSAIGFEKPDRRTFQFVMQEMQIPPEALLHIGDSPHDDAKGAINAGAKAMLVKRSRQSRRDPETQQQTNTCPCINSLADIFS